jgi:glycosyltransferase involved in cell wall biosynthesis
VDAVRKVEARYIPLDRNRGLSVARNVGFALSRGEWIVVLDSDDKIEPGLSRFLRQQPQSVQLVSCDSTYFNDTNTEYRPVSRYKQLFESYAKSSLDPFLWFDFYYHGIIARRKLLRSIGGYRGDLEVGEDQDILLRAVEAIQPGNVLFAERAWYHYRENPEGLCATRWPAVVGNYTRTMLEGAWRRGAPFTGCRYGSKLTIDGARIDCYEYQLDGADYIDWHSWRLMLGGGGG